jgi:hypothetical protein
LKLQAGRPDHDKTGSIQPPGQQLRLTKAGEKCLQAALKGWSQAQARSEALEPGALPTFADCCERPQRANSRPGVNPSIRSAMHQRREHIGGRSSACPRRTPIAVNAFNGGQAVVGTIQTPGGGDQSKSEDQPHAKQIAHAPQPAMWSADKEREPVPVTRHAERPLPDARRTIPRSPQRK